MRTWDGAFEGACNEAIAGLLAAAAPEAERKRHWQDLLRLIAPHLEHWAGASWLLARWRLVSEDDARTVMVNVIGRLEQRDFDNLRRYQDRAQPTGGDDEQGLAIERIARLADDAPEPEPEEPAATAFRAWLLTLLRFASRDYIRERMGWSDGGANKRDVNTNAARVDDGPEKGERPPMTDFLTVRGLLDDIEKQTAEFPADMRRALEMWTEDHRYDEIATAMALEDAAAARKLVRAALARLRERFRDQWSGFLAS